MIGEKRIMIEKIILTNEEEVEEVGEEEVKEVEDAEKGEILIKMIIMIIIIGTIKIMIMILGEKIIMKKKKIQKKIIIKKKIIMIVGEIMKMINGEIIKIIITMDLGMMIIIGVIIGKEAEIKIIIKILIIGKKTNK